MTKIYIITDDGQSLKVLTCNDIEAQELFYDDDKWYLYGHKSRFGTYQFTASNVVIDESPDFISLPDELLLRIRDYNIDVEHEYALEQTRKLKQKNDSLQQSIGDHLVELNELEKEVKHYHEVINKMIDRYPMAAAEVALQNGNIEAACYFAEKANEENEDD